MDSDDPGHVTCNQGPLNGRAGACDNGRGVRGGYHYAVEYLLLVANHGKNFDPKVRDMALRKAHFHLGQKFNTEEPAAKE